MISFSCWFTVCFACGAVCGGLHCLSGGQRYVVASAGRWFDLVGLGLLFGLYLLVGFGWVWLVMPLFRCGFGWIWFCCVFYLCCLLRCVLLIVVRGC